MKWPHHSISLELPRKKPFPKGEKAALPAAAARVVATEWIHARDGGNRREPSHSLALFYVFYSLCSTPMASSVSGVRALSAATGVTPQDPPNPKPVRWAFAKL